VAELEKRTSSFGSVVATQTLLPAATTSWGAAAGLVGAHDAAAGGVDLQHGVQLRIGEVAATEGMSR
jgi:hypothetical protein